MTLMISLLHYARTEVSIAVSLRIQVVWDMMVCVCGGLLKSGVTMCGES